jgi:hypothetical protein
VRIAVAPATAVSDFQLDDFPRHPSTLHRRTLPWRQACIVPTGICASNARQKLQSTLESITYLGFAANKPLAFEEGPASP